MEYEFRNAALEYILLGLSVVKKNLRFPSRKKTAPAMRTRKLSALLTLSALVAAPYVSGQACFQGITTQGSSFVAFFLESI